MGGSSKVCAPVVEAVPVPVIDKHFVRRPKNDAVHVGRDDAAIDPFGAVGVARVSTRLETPLEQGQFSVVFLVNDGDAIRVFEGDELQGVGVRGNRL